MPAVVYRRAVRPPPDARGTGTHFTCCTSKKVHILTQMVAAQSLEHQMKSCTRYNRRQQWNNLLEDCTAGDELVPRRTHLLLEHHTDEVWHIQFSGCGKMLASGSKDKTVIIWSLHDKPLIKHHLKQHTDAVSYVAWSPDDKWLVSGVCACV